MADLRNLQKVSFAPEEKFKYWFNTGLGYNSSLSLSINVRRKIFDDSNRGLERNLVSMRSSQGMSKAYNSTSYSGCIGTVDGRTDLLAARRTNKPSGLQHDRSETEIYARENRMEVSREKEREKEKREPDSRGGRRLRERQRVSARTQEGEQIIEGGRGGHLLRSC